MTMLPFTPAIPQRTGSRLKESKCSIACSPGLNAIENLKSAERDEIRKPLVIKGRDTEIGEFTKEEVMVDFVEGLGKVEINNIKSFVGFDESFVSGYSTNKRGLYQSEDIVAFLSLIEAYPVLWDASSENFHRREVSQKIYDQIEEKCFKFMPRGKNAHALTLLVRKIILPLNWNLSDFSDHCLENMITDTPKRKKSGNDDDFYSKRQKKFDKTSDLIEKFEKSNEAITQALKNALVPDDVDEKKCKSERICKVFQEQTAGWPDVEKYVAEAKILATIRSLKLPGNEAVSSNFGNQDYSRVFLH
uniref:MADF domain-containing protein n=2 Tax=Caenorhabditis japonica TaxID=281687 RepID=A0A8R1HXG6_CAEJA